MKRVVTFIVLIAFVVNCGFSLRKESPWQQVQRFAAQRKHVGKVIVIDAERREQLGLFPGIEGFKEAKFVGVSGGGYEVNIVTDTERLVSVNRDPIAMAILLDFIDNYRTISDNRSSFEAMWQIIDYDTLGAPITQSEVNRIVTPDRATSCGLYGGVLAALAAGAAVVAIAASEDTGSSDVGVAIGLLLSPWASAIAGASTGCLIRHHVFGQDKKKAVEEIKEQRRPRVVE